MHHLPPAAPAPADELAEVRAQIARLRMRESELSIQLLMAPAALIHHRLRPGWPIRRQVPPTAETLTRH